MTVARFRFHAELNDFLRPAHRGGRFAAHCAPAASVKHAIESLGVPHTEVALVIVNGASVDFSHRMREGDEVEVHPASSAAGIPLPARVRPAPLPVLRFVADAHLGGLARLLRMAGFDTLYDNAVRDDVLVRIAGDEQRMLLTRDRALLHSRALAHALYLRAQKPADQVREIDTRVGLRAHLRPFTRCLACNRPLEPIAKSAVLERLPPAVAQRHDDFRFCDQCGRIYWAGSHWARMRERLVDLFADRQDAAVQA